MSIEIIFEDDIDKTLGDENSLGFKMIKGFSIYKHQEEAIKWMITKEYEKKLNVCGGILALTMGLGKTLTTTGLCMTEKHNPVFYNTSRKKYEPVEFFHGLQHSFPNLVVCSKTIAGEWKRDIKKFFGDSCPLLFFHKENLPHFDDLTYSSIKNYKMIITTYETVMTADKKHGFSEKFFVLDQFGRKSGILNCTKPSPEKTNSAKGSLLLFSIPWNRVICDESHRFSNPKSSTFYSIMALYGEKKWCLSGTPLRNYSSDIYSQLRFCGYDRVVSSSQFNYKTYEKEKLFEFILCKNYEDAGIKLPESIEHVLEVELEGREKELYDYYLGETKKVYNGFLVGTSNFSCVLALFLRLRQVCVSPYTVLEESSRNYKGKNKEEYSISQEILDRMTDGLSTWLRDKYGSSGLNSVKMKTLVKILSQIKDGEKTLVFTSFKKVIDIASLSVKTHLPDKKFLILDGDVTGKERESTIEKFKKENYDILFISYKVGSEGLNFTEATNIIMCENWWTPVVEQQAKARSHRIGQSNTVNIWKMVCNNSIEERIEKICREKLSLIDDFLISKKKFSSKLDSQTLGNILR